MNTVQKESLFHLTVSHPPATSHEPRFEDYQDLWVPQASKQLWQEEEAGVGRESDTRVSSGLLSSSLSVFSASQNPVATVRLE